ncbi:Pentatricopeptide repeat-containing protein, mitochondrial [Glycine soja]|uniref:Pentatricopeptide repeat-containing protein, mitochondrial n=1 Tax=Glycine soja TaxID=3848 RepID=A0A0B2PF58_GLYSO|nr:Pentatricopeptide repeat-containing protein, mitochondrial [Glycine soja]
MLCTFGSGTLDFMLWFYSHSIDFKELKVEEYLNVVVIRLLIVIIIIWELITYYCLCPDMKSGVGFVMALIYHTITYIVLQIGILGKREPRFLPLNFDTISCQLSGVKHIVVIDFLIPPVYRIISATYVLMFLFEQVTLATFSPFNFGLLFTLRFVVRFRESVTFPLGWDGEGGMTLAYCELKKPNEALECFYFMKENGFVPNVETCNQMLSLFLKLNRTQMAWVLYAEVFRINIRSSVYTFNIMINRVIPDEITYNTLLQGYCREGKVEEARLLLDEMKRRGIKPDLISYNTLISGYSKRGDMKDAFGVRDEMMTTGFDPTILTYDALIQGLCKNREGEHAEELLKEMVSKGIPPDDSTYLSIIEAMEAVDDLEENDDK